MIRERITARARFRVMVRKLFELLPGPDPHDGCSARWVQRTMGAAHDGCSTRWVQHTMSAAHDGCSAPSELAVGIARHVRSATAAVSGPKPDTNTPLVSLLFRVRLSILEPCWPAPSRPNPNRNPNPNPNPNPAGLHLRKNTLAPCEVGPHHIPGFDPRHMRG